MEIEAKLNKIIKLLTSIRSWIAALLGFEIGRLISLYLFT